MRPAGVARVTRMDLDLRRARYFQAVARELHFGRAAQVLHVAQPALSRQIAALERELGVRLLERSTQRVSLTDAGKSFFEEIVPVIAAADDAILRLRQRERGGSTLVVGFMPGLFSGHAINAVAAKFPSVVIEVRELNWRNQAELVRDASVDIALVRRPLDTTGLAVRDVVGDPRGVLLPSTHTLARESSIRLSQVSGHPVIRHRHAGVWDDYWTVNPRPDGSAPVLGPMVETVPEKLAIVSSGAAITFVPRSAALAYRSPDVVWVRVSDIEDSLVALAWLPNSRAAPLLTFADAVADAPDAATRAGRVPEEWSAAER